MRLHSAWLLVAVLESAACAGAPADQPEDTAGAGAPDGVGTDPEPDVAAADLPEVGGSGDTDGSTDTGPSGPCGPLGEPRVYVIRALRFARDVEGVSAGFDLDGRVSDGADAGGCRKLDLTAPDGTAGIDNQFASLLPAIEAAGGIAFEGLIQSAINEGDILMLVELTSVDSLTEDACVGVSIGNGVGVPLLDSNGEMESGQTFGRDPAAIASHVDGARIEGGTLRIEGIAVTVPAYVFFYEFRVPVDEARVEMRIGADGTASGVIGGGITVQALIDIVSQIEGAGGVPDAVTALAPNLADLDPGEDGVCRAVSAVLEFEAVPAFYYADAPMEGSGE